MAYYFLEEISSISSKMARINYKSCSIFEHFVAFGLPSGSIHVFSMETEELCVISFEWIVSLVHLISFSPSGKYLFAATSDKIFVISNPTTQSAKIILSFDFRSPSAVRWISDPPQALIKSNFLVVGDSDGGIWYVKNTGPEKIGDCGSSIFQISSTSENFIINSLQSAFFLSNYQLTPIRSKREPGEFGGVFAPELDLICFSRENGNLLLSTREGKAKAKTRLIGNQPPFEGKLDLGRLTFCNPFLLSFGSGNLGFIINLPKLTLEETLPFVDFIDSSIHNSNVFILLKEKAFLFHAYSSVEEYVAFLISRKDYKKAQDLAISCNITDQKLLSGMNVSPSQSFIKFLEKENLKKSPKPLSDVNQNLFSEFAASSVPTSTMMNKLFDMLSLVIVEEVVKSKITEYIVQNPSQWRTWNGYFNVDSVVERINEDPENSMIVSEMSKFGTSKLCQCLSNTDDLSISFCVANSPPIYSHNLSPSRRDEFNLAFKSDDSTTSPLIISLFQDRKEKLGSNVSREDLFYLLQLNIWETNLNSCFQKLSSAIEFCLIEKSSSLVPSWIQTCMQKEHSKESLDWIQQTSEQHWGVGSSFTVCMLCGLPLNTRGNTSSSTLFQCSHAFHLSCLKHQYCPICVTLMPTTV